MSSVRDAWDSGWFTSVVLAPESSRLGFRDNAEPDLLPFIETIRDKGYRERGPKYVQEPDN